MCPLGCADNPGSFRKRKSSNTVIHLTRMTLCDKSKPLSLTGSASRTDLSQLANGIWEIHAGRPSFLRVSSVAKIGYIPQFKASNARDQDEVSSDLSRMKSKQNCRRMRL